MGYIVLTRNPSTKKLIVIMNDDHEEIAEFPTENEAIDAVVRSKLCSAWDYEVVEVG